MQQAKAPFKWRFLFYREVAAISATYPNLNGTSFPENIDSFPKKTEPGIEDLTKIEQYHAKYAAHDLAGANAILSTYPELKTMLINAETLNQYRDAIIAIETYYKYQYETYLANTTKQIIINQNQPSGQLKDDTIVTTIMSNLGLYKACDKIGMKYEKTQVGDKYVYENMVKNGFMLGGEQSGHIIFSKHATTGDGILTSLMLMEVIMETKQSLGQLTEEVKIYPQLLKNVRVADKKTARENPEVVKAVDAVAEALGDDGRILVRESGTEPVIRVMVEAATDELCEKYVTQVIDVIEKEGLIVE